MTRFKHVLVSSILLIVLLTLTFCQSDQESLGTENKDAFTKSSSIVALIKAAIEGPDAKNTISSKSTDDDDDSDDDDNDDDDDDDDNNSNNEQCAQFKYPISFYAQIDPNQNLEFVIINSDEDLLNFFDSLAANAEIRIDFPIVLLGVDGESTTINSLSELEETLKIVVDACRGSDDYEYCHENNKKVYICHNGNTLCVSINAVNAHLAHGDELGKCDDDDDDDDDNN